jgi:hypothetical protein
MGVIALGGTTARILAALFTIALLARCGPLPSNFEMYPQAVTGDRDISEQTAIVLVGNAGPASLGYLQFVHSGMPAINVQNIELRPRGIVAVPVPVGLTALELANYTVSGQAAGYLSSGTSYGYVPVRTPRMDIPAHGVYYVASILPDARPNFSSSPDPAMLTQFKNTHPRIANLKALNFTWPR